tara:strand:+ start:5160 stop:5906 length:747 start_codon:yes stop_codon:yes gene_type:complete
MKKQIKYLLVFIALAFTFSCDLPLQDTYDFDPELTIVDPYADGTAWDFFNSPNALRVRESDGALLGDSYNYLVAAIEKAGFVDLYNQTDNADRTYLMLNNNAFRGGGDVIQLVTGSSSEDVTVIENGVPVTRPGTPAEVMERVDTPEELEVLRTILRYHIVDAYMAIIPQLAETNTQYIFQTLIPGEGGQIAFLRDDRYRTDINDDRRAPLPFPSSATGQRERIRNQNYIFNNGIGHSINDPVRYFPY